MPGASWPELLRFHRDQMEQMRSQGSRFVGGLSVDQAVQADRTIYRDQVAHWVKIGLLIPERDKGAGSPRNSEWPSHSSVPFSAPLDALTAPPAHLDGPGLGVESRETPPLKYSPPGDHDLVPTPRR